MTDNQISLTLNLCKFIGTALTGAFGVLGLISDFRDPITKRITKWGKVAFFGVVASTIVALVAQVLEANKTTNEAKAAAEAAQAQIGKSDLILRNVDRSLNPLTDIRISYRLRVPFDAQSLISYKQRLEKGVSQIVVNHAAHKSTMRLGSPAMIRKDGTVGIVRIPADSPLFPNKSELVSYYVLWFSGLDLQFFLKANDLNRLSDTNPAHFPKADLEMPVNSEQDFHSANSYTLEYDLRDHTVQIVAYQLLTDPSVWRGSGKIVSTNDLAGSQLAAVVDNLLGPAPAADGKPTVASQEITRLRRSMTLTSLVLQVRAQDFWINMKNTERVERGGVAPALMFVTSLPTDLQTLRMR